MSFGASPTDIIAVVTLCKSLYRECRAAGGEYDEISHEVRSLHTVLRHLKYEAEAPKSPLNRDRAIWTHQLAPTIAGCDSTLKQLSALVLKYGSKRGASSSGKHKVGSNEMDQLGAIRVKVISLKRALTAFLDLIQLPPSTMASNLDNTDGQLDALLDKVDAIAARLGQRHEDGNREAWKQFRRELIAEGFSSDVLQQNEVRYYTILTRCGAMLMTGNFRMYFEPTYEKWTRKDSWITRHQKILSHLIQIARQPIDR